MESPMQRIGSTGPTVHFSGRCLPTNSFTSMMRFRFRFHTELSAILETERIRSVRAAVFFERRLREDAGSIARSGHIARRGLLGTAEWRAARKSASSQSYGAR